jgi:PAS domain S-box-containing protein
MSGASALHILSIAALTAGAVLAGLLAVVAWRRRDVPGAPAFVVLMAAAALWAAVYGLELAAAGQPAKVTLLKLEYLGIVAVPGAWLAFALDYTGRRHWLAPWRLALLCALPLATLALAVTNEAHGLVWRSITLDETGPFPALHLGRGAWYWVNVAYAYAALCAGTVLLAMALLRTSRPHRRPAVALLIGVALPWLANAVYIAGLEPAPNLDPTPIAFALGGLAFAWGLFRFRLLDVVLGLAPLAHDALIDGMADAVLVLDTGGRLVDLNPAATRLIGRPAAAVLDRPASTMLAGWPAAVVGDEIATAQASLEVADAGGARHYDVLVSPLWRRDGRPAGRLIVARDVTERRRAERRLELLAEAGRVLSSSLDVEATLSQVARLVVPMLADYCYVDVVDERGAIRDVAVAHVDPAREEMLRAMRSRYPPDLGAPSGVAAVLRTGQSELIAALSEDELAATTRDAEHRRLLRTIGPTSRMIVPLAARDQVLGAITFVSARAERRYQADDLALAEALARRAAVAIDNARLYAAAQEAISLREEFLGIAAHELRTPLTTVKGYVQLNRRLLQRPVLDRDRLAAAQAALERQVGRQVGLIDDLLDVARIQRGQLALRPEPVDLVEVARQVLDRFEHAPERTPRHRLTLEATAPVAGHWDPDRLDQVLTNLVSNALKYSPDGGAVTVRVAACDGQAELTVRDEGLGITPEEQAHLFRPFARGRPAAGIGGVGLGLYIVAQIVARHGGEVAVESRPGTGSAFTIRLPLAAPEARGRPALDRRDEADESSEPLAADSGD